AVDTVAGFTGGNQGTANTGRKFVSLKPITERTVSADDVIARLRPKLAGVPGASLYLQAIQDIRVGGRLSNALFQFTLQGDNLHELDRWAPRMLAKLQTLPDLADVNTDQQNRGREAFVTIDRDTAARLGVTPQAIDEALYDAFGQRQVSTMYTQLNQYHVVMEVAPPFWQSPETLKDVYVRGANGMEVPLAAIAHFAPTTAALAVNHQGQFPSVTLSFNLPPGVALGQAVDAIERAARDLGLPAGIHATFQGTAQAFQASLANEPLLILAALVTVYIVLGILYESYIHPLTILSTLPSAGVGAILALLLCRNDLSVIALIGIIIVGGLLLSQLLTLYTTPVVYLYLDRFSLWFHRLRERRFRRAAGAPSPASS